MQLNSKSTEARREIDLVLRVGITILGMIKNGMLNARDRSWSDSKIGDSRNLMT